MYEFHGTVEIKPAIPKPANIKLEQKWLGGLLLHRCRSKCYNWVGKMFQARSLTGKM